MTDQLFFRASPDAGIVGAARALTAALARLDDETRIATLNQVRRLLHEVSPFRDEPVDCVEWVRAEDVTANDYNPNAVAPPEMRLLEHSIAADGYTQPIVVWARPEAYEVVDGFHRNRVGRESPAVGRRIRGYLPLTIINADREERNDRIAATIRHNRARGKHRVDAMSDIVVELKRRNWTDEKISKELGMEPDEILRLTQITGLAELFKDQAFSRSWDVVGEITEADYAELSDEVDYEPELGAVRTGNTSDAQRIFHRHETWECYQAGFYQTTKPGMTKAECETAYRDFLADDVQFRAALEHVIAEWTHSCEHYLTNAGMNRIAWLGQAAACYALGIPAVYRGGFHLLTEEQQARANATAHDALNRWLTRQGRPEVSLEEAYSYERQQDLY